MSKQEIIDYVMTTPSNPNKAVLEGMLDSFSDGEGGGGSSRVLLYENDALDISQTSGNWIYSGTALTISNAWFNSNSQGNWVLSIDGEELSSELNASGNDFYIGVENPGDSEHVGVNRLGCLFGHNGSFISGVQMIMLDKNFFTAGTHSVKIYKEA